MNVQMGQLGGRRNIITYADGAGLVKSKSNITNNRGDNTFGAQGVVRSKSNITNNRGDFGADGRTPIIKSKSNITNNAEGDVVVVPPIMKSLPMILGSVGTLWGLRYAFKHNGGWSYLGYSLLGSVAGSIFGGIALGLTYPSYYTEKKIGASGSVTGRGGSSARSQAGCWEHTGQGSVYRSPCPSGKE